VGGARLPLKRYHMGVSRPEKDRCTEDVRYCRAVGGVEGEVERKKLWTPLAKHQSKVRTIVFRELQAVLWGCRMVTGCYFTGLCAPA
jgi:hypothetical protein